MSVYLVFVIFAAGASAVLLLAGLVASGGRWRPALRYMRTWLKHVLALAAVGLLLSLAFM